MAKSLFVCQSCLAQLRQTWARRPSPAPLMRLALRGQRLPSSLSLYSTDTSQPEPQSHEAPRDRFDEIFGSQEPPSSKPKPRGPPKVHFEELVDPLQTQAAKPKRKTKRWRKYVPFGEEWLDMVNPRTVHLQARRRRYARLQKKRRRLRAQFKPLDHPQYPAEDKTFWNTYAQLARASLETRSGAVPMSVHDLFLADLEYLYKTVDKLDITRERKRLKWWNESMGKLLRGVKIQAGGGTELLSRLADLYVYGKSGEAAEAWATIEDDLKRKLWPSLMLAAIEARPETAFRLFQATFDHTLVRPYVARALIIYFALQLMRERASPDMPKVPKAIQLEAMDMLMTLLDECPKEYLNFRQNIIFQFIGKCPPEKLAILYQRLVDYEHPLHVNTRLQFASHLAKIPAEKELAVDMLRELVQTDVDINGPVALSICTSILCFPEQNEDGTPFENDGTYASPPELLDSLLDIGLKPNVITYTALMRQLCVARKLGTAWKVYETMVEHGIAPDSQAYCTLMNGAKDLEDWSSMCHVVELALEHQAHDQVFWNEFLHGIFAAALVQARKLPVPRIVPAFVTMIQAYIKVFDLEDLKLILPGNLDRFRDLGDDISEALDKWTFYHAFTPTIKSLPLVPDEELIKPDSRTLTTLVLGYVKGTSNVQSVLALYQNFSKLLHEGNEVALRIVQTETTVVHDTIIKFLCEREPHIPDALDIISAMLQHKTGSPHPAPSLRTWNILLNAFLFHRHNRQAQEIMRIMRKHDLKPDIVTWNTMVAGAGRMQNVQWTVEALTGMEKAGLTADDFTNKAWGYLNNQSAALQTLQRIAEARKRAKERKALRGLEGVYEALKDQVMADIDGIDGNGVAIDWKSVWDKKQ